MSIPPACRYKNCTAFILLKKKKKKALGRERQGGVGGQEIRQVKEVGICVAPPAGETWILQPLTYTPSTSVESHG